MAVPWLHVLSEHPNNLPQYSWIFEQPGPLAVAGRKLRRYAGIARTLACSLIEPRSDAVFESPKFPARVDALFISHLVSDQVNAESADFYYGSLPEELASRGLKSLVALINHVPGKGSILRERLTRRGMASRVVLPDWLTFKEEIRIVRRARNVASMLHEKAAYAETRFSRMVISEAMHHAVTGRTMDAMRLHDSVRRLCSRFRPRAVIVTWEGHAWERLAFCAAREIDPAVRCIGYQHTILFPRAHALKRSLGKEYDPDVILTVGDVNRNVLRKADALSGVIIMTYGSHRRLAPPERRAPDSATRCLVIPEGLESECLILFDFALAAAAHAPDIQFVLRTHPVLSFDWLVRHHPRLRDLPANVRVSDQAAITADFARCDWALYRGSSAAVHAVLAGVRPVYVERPGELPIDPLFAMKGWRHHVATVEAFGAVIAADRAAAPEDRHREWEPARAFCDRYAVPPDPDIVRGILKE